MTQRCRRRCAHRLGILGALLPIEKISQLFEDEINKRLRDKTPVQELHIMDGVIEITLAGK
jgi:hypothetical protein